MARTIETACAACGKEMEVDVSNDAGADQWSVAQQDNYCSTSCRMEDL